MYFYDELLIGIYMINVVFTFFILCHGMSSYYSWLKFRSRNLRINRVDKRLYNNLPKTHLTFLFFLILQSIVQMCIDLMELPEEVIIIKPNYISIGVAFLIELYFYLIVRRYVKVSIEYIKDIDR